MQEQRQPPRTRVLKAAKVIFNQHGSVINCTVCNLSNSGACLQVSSPVELPETFELSFDSFRSVRRSQVRWRTQSTIGVSFSLGG